MPNDKREVLEGEVITTSKSSNTSKFVGVVAVVGLTAAQAQAALTVGAIDLTDFNTVAGVVVVALGAFYAVKAGLRLLR